MNCFASNVERRSWLTSRHTDRVNALIVAGL